MIMGVTGTFRSGKDTAANYLVSEGFIHYSLADYKIFNAGVGAGSVKLLEQKIYQVLRELEKGGKK